MESIICTTCRVPLNTQDESRAHYKTSFHTYNLKRKYVSLPPVSSEVYEYKQKESALLATIEEKVYKCDCCNKVFPTQKSLSKHIRNNQVSLKPFLVDHRLTCLICNEVFLTIELNIKHMLETHGFFIPNLEDVKNLEGLLEYLHKKVRELMLCLYCNNRQGHNFRTLQAVQQHMVDKQHCFLNTDEDEEEFKEFYICEEGSFEVLSSEEEIKLNEYIDLDSQSSDTYSFSLIGSNHTGLPPGITLTNIGELRLENGKIIGTKEFARFYKQNFKVIPKRLQDLLAIVSEAHENIGNNYTWKSKREFVDADNSKNFLKIGLKGNSVLQPHFRSQN